MNAANSVEFRDLPERALPRSLAERTKLVTLPVDGGIPALLVHPDHATDAPVFIWMHGRTVDKFLDPGRYSRLVRAGIAVCAIDLPGHGERISLLDQPKLHDPAHSLGVIAQAAAEIDGVVRTLGSLAGFDVTRVALGGMSLGGMVTLRRLCDAHGFACAAVEATSGNLAGLYFDDGSPRAAWPVEHTPADVAPADPMQHLDTFDPLPMLVLHSEADEMVPWPTQKVFLDRLAARYAAAGADPGLVSVRTWPTTGAPAEHVGFGSVSHEAKTLQTEFLTNQLGVTA
ncbi:MAG: alpha/beta fold hydrolase [Planctomycetota bacterium]